LGIDRKKLEEERLARVAKRKAEASISPPPLRRDTKLAKREGSLGDGGVTWSISPSSSAQPLSQSSAKNVEYSEQMNDENESEPLVATKMSLAPSPRYPKGVVKKTWVFGCPRNGDDIKIEEVLNSADLELAILSAFQWDMEWLFSKFRRRDTRFMLVMQAKEESTVRNLFGCPIPS
jgi:hypothetical protein